jgi:hypothetical protein
VDAVTSLNRKGGSFMDSLRQTEYEWELEGEGEGEFEGELELEGEGEWELEGEGEWELEGEGEFELEGEFEGEEFFRRIARGVGGFIRRAAPILRQVARVAAPMVGTAVGGPLGGMIGRAASSLLREGELEFEGEFEDELEFEGEGEFEGEAEGPLTRRDATAEMMAAVAAQAQTEAEAEAMAGAATVASLSPRDRAALERVLPHLVRGTAVLTRLLRRRQATRPAVRAVPTIVRRTTRTLAQRAAAGQPVTRQTAARVMATQTRRVLGQPRTCAAAIQRNVRAAQTATRQTRQPRPPQRRRPTAN